MFSGENCLWEVWPCRSRQQNFFFWRCSYFLPKEEFEMEFAGRKLDGKPRKGRLWGQSQHRALLIYNTSASNTSWGSKRGAFSWCGTKQGLWATSGFAFLCTGEINMQIRYLRRDKRSSLSYLPARARSLLIAPPWCFTPVSPTTPEGNVRLN